ncbi:hypothetical protein ACU4GD_34015 [Cupriavidus basilensis]
MLGLPTMTFERRCIEGMRSSQIAAQWAASVLMRPLGVEVVEELRPVGRPVVEPLEPSSEIESLLG